MVETLQILGQTTYQLMQDFFHPQYLHGKLDWNFQVHQSHDPSVTPFPRPTGMRKCRRQTHPRQLLRNLQLFQPDILVLVVEMQHLTKYDCNDGLSG